MGSADGRVIFPATIVVDLVLGIPALPDAGGEVDSTSSFMRAGGGFPAIAAAVRGGAAVVYAGRYGDGPLGAVASAALRAEGVEPVHPPLAGVDTGACVVLVDAKEQRRVVAVPGAEARLTRADLDAVQVRPEDTVYLSGYGLAHPASPLVEWLATLPEPTRVFFDPSPLVTTVDPPAIDPGALATVLARSDVVSATAREARALTGRSEVADAARALLGRMRNAAIDLPAGAVLSDSEKSSPAGTGHWPLAVVREGADGAWVARLGSAPEFAPGATVPAANAAAVDAMGAGDRFGGAAAAALARGEEPLAAVRRAGAALAETQRTRTSAPISAPAGRPSGDEPLPAVDRVVVQDVTLANPRPVGRIQSRRITMQPDVPAGLHLHNGPVVGSIEAGSVTYQVEGAPARTLRTGDTFYEEEGARIARFDAGPDGAVFLAHFPIGTDAEPTLTMLEPPLADEPRS